MELDKIVEAIESTSNEIRWYYNSLEKKLCMASSYDFDGEYVFDIDEMEAKDEMIALPSSYDIDEYWYHVQNILARELV